MRNSFCRALLWPKQAWWGWCSPCPHWKGSPWSVCARPRPSQPSRDYGGRCSSDLCRLWSALVQPAPVDHRCCRCVCCGVDAAKWPGCSLPPHLDAWACPTAWIWSHGSHSRCVHCPCDAPPSPPANCPPKSHLPRVHAHRHWVQQWPGDCHYWVHPWRATKL